MNREFPYPLGLGTKATTKARREQRPTCKAHARKHHSTHMAPVKASYVPHHSTVRLVKSAISAPSLLVGHQMYCRTVRLAKSTISAPNVSGPPNVPYHSQTGKKCNFCTYFLTGPPNVPYHSQTDEKCNYCTYFLSGPPNVP